MSNGRSVTISAILLAAVFLIPALAATCPFLDVSGIYQANITAGGQGAFPLTLTNLGVKGQLIQLSGSCQAGVSCSFSPSSQDVLVPSQTKTFTLLVDSNKPGNYTFPLLLSAEGNACQELSYNVLVNPAPSASSAAFSVSVYPDANSSVRPGDSVPYQITIHNYQTALGYARLKVESPLKATTDFDYVDIDLPPQADKTVTVKVTVPAGTPRGVYEQLFTVDAFDGSGCCSHSYVVKRPLFVFADKLLLNLQNAPLSCLRVLHGQKSTYTFRLRNDGEVTGPYDFELVGAQAATSASHLDAPRLEIAPGDAQDLTWTLQPPTTLVLDRYSMLLRVRYLDWTVSETPVCFIVDAQRGFSLGAQDSYPIFRGEPGNVTFTVRNNGTALATYTVNAVPPKSFDFRVTEPSFTLTPGQVKTVVVLVATSLSTPLGELKLPIDVSDGRIRQSLNAYLNVQSSLLPGKSLLQVETKPVTAYAGVPQTVRIGVSNKAARTQHGVNVTLFGLPLQWYSLSDDAQDIVAAKTAYYDLQINVPADTRAQATRFTILAQDREGERTQANATLTVLEAPAYLDVAVTSVQRNGDQVSFTVVVYNNGLKTLDGVTVTSGTNTQTIGPLAPGEQRVAAFQGLATAPIVVQAQSAEGVKSRSVTVPLDQQSRLDLNGLLVILVVLILLLVAIAFLLRKETLEKFTYGAGKA